MGSGRELDGEFAFVLKDKGGQIVLIGVSGVSLKTQGLNVTLSRSGQVVLSRKETLWQIESAGDESGGIAVKVSGNSIAAEAQLLRIPENTLHEHP
jgi:hypothetical protein